MTETKVKSLSVGICNMCGGTEVIVRGRTPKDNSRVVCPTCLTETLDDIKSRLSEDYNRVYSEVEQLAEKLDKIEVPTKNRLHL